MIMINKAWKLDWKIALFGSFERRMSSMTLTDKNMKDFLKQTVRIQVWSQEAMLVEPLN